jgi:hypothetical protein
MEPIFDEEEAKKIKLYILPNLLTDEVLRESNHMLPSFFPSKVTFQWNGKKKSFPSFNELSNGPKLEQ